MKNREKYKDEIIKHEINFCVNFVKPVILKSMGLKCTDGGCDRCQLIQAMWLEEEYQEPKKPEVDWNKVEVDTPVLVRTCNGFWIKRHFAKENQGVIYTWNDGRTSWTLANADANDIEYVEPWDCAKLADEE